MPTDHGSVTLDLLHDDVSGLLRAGDHRYTRGRRRVVEALHEGGAPLTIPQILDVDGGLAQSSVYRNLAILEEVGAVTRIVTHDDHARYELAENLTDHHHHHLICSVCGDVRDFSFPPGVEKSLGAAFGKVSKSTGFTVESHRLDLVGRCDNCS
jgi:Fe2+ or Zn2+ uptake regulation protein